MVIEGNPAIETEHNIARYVIVDICVSWLTECFFLVFFHAEDFDHSLGKRCGSSALSEKVMT